MYENFRTRLEAAIVDVDQSASQHSRAAIDQKQIGALAGVTPGYPSSDECIPLTTFRTSWSKGDVWDITGEIPSVTPSRDPCRISFVTLQPSHNATITTRVTTQAQTTLI
ncbi:hypothetical protein M758_10G145800 [Ceratodon purpureus]|nr:hypothetical protein M758_10G145800 [Ceratodon purpureus]